MQLHSALSNYVHSAHIGKLDHTLKVPKSTMCFQAFGCFSHTFAANAHSRPFRLGDFHSFCVFPCGGPFAAVARPLRNLLRYRTFFALDSAGLSKRRSWSFEAVHCSDAASLLHPPAATFTTLCEYREDSPAPGPRMKGIFKREV